MALKEAVSRNAPAALWRCLKLLFHLEPRWAAFGALILAAEAGFGLASLYALKNLVTTANLGDSPQILTSLVWAGLLTLLYVLLRSAAAVYGELFGDRISDHIEDMVNRQAGGVDLAFCESARYNDLQSRALMVGGSRPARVVLNIFQLLQNALMVLALAAIILTVHFILIPILCLALIPGVAVRLLATRRLHEWQVRRTQTERQAGYFRWTLTDQRNAKEIRALSLAGFFCEKFRALRSKLRAERAQISIWRTGTELLINVGATLAFFIALGYLASKAVAGEGSLADLVLFLLVFQRGQGVLQSLKSNTAILFEDALYLRHLFEFLDVRALIVDEPGALPTPLHWEVGLEVRGLCFSYPNADRAVLDDVSLNVRPGQIVALVGANGSGKTTLIKLLLRLYQPQQGSICLEGKTLACYQLNAWRHQVSVIFQDFVQYYATASDNVRFGDSRLAEEDPRILDAAARTGALRVFDGLPQGAQTRLGRVFDHGHELSQGQWQKIALARAIVADTQFVIMDEPTSALDPGAEFELFRDLRAVIGSRAALVISHRLSTVRQADRIYVLDQGRIVESGTHDELIAARGRYHELFEQQAHHYR